jgi:RNA polymerase sigma-70 factor (ECF subfamily)
MAIMATDLIDRAQAGDEQAFSQLVEPYQRELQVHCYRILGSAQDAEDAVQETLLTAWRSLGGFEQRSSLRTWLYRIATTRSLNALRSASRRPPAEWPNRAITPPEPTRLGEITWLEPYPDVLLDELPDTSPGPAARYEARESISLAFITALQHLPPRQRATLVLRDALGFRAAETADILGCSLDAVNGSLKRARASLAQRLPAGGLSQAPLPGSGTERELLARFTDAFEHGDVAALVAMLTDDTWLTMPPLPFGYRGRDAAAHLLSVVSFRGGSRRFRLVAARANGQPAFGCYITDAQAPIAHAHGLMMLTLAGDRIAGVTRFLDNSLLAGFGLPRTLPDYHPRHARTPLDD